MLELELVSTKPPKFSIQRVTDTMLATATNIENKGNKMHLSL
jgi:hypothetical protein